MKDFTFDTDASLKLHPTFHNRKYHDDLVKKEDQSYVEDVLSGFDLTNLPICPYCNQQAELVSNIVLYKKSYGSGLAWLCRPCGAYALTPDHSAIPIGLLADRKLREIRKETLSMFNSVWDSKVRSRENAFNWLTSQLGVSIQHPNFTRFDFELCLRAQAIMKQHFPQAIL